MSTIARSHEDQLNPSEQDLTVLVLDGTHGLLVNDDFEAATNVSRLAKQLIAAGVVKDWSVAVETVRCACEHIGAVCKHEDEVPDKALTDVRALLQFARTKGWDGPQGSNGH